MEQSIYSLVYLSTASLSSENELADILTKSRQNNPSLGITGMLFYAEGIFLQVLEGKKEAVEDLYNKILNDKRHYGVFKVLSTVSEKRNFENWSMGFKTISKKELAQSLLEDNAVKDEAFIQLIKNNKTNVLLFIKSFYENNFEHRIAPRL